MNPYYSDDWVTIYHGDCREILPGLDFDCIVSDPPYRMEVDSGKFNRISKAGGCVDALYEWHEVEHSGGVDTKLILAQGCPTVLFGANGYASELPSHPGWIVWDKQADGFKQGSPAELAWTNFLPNLRLFRLNYRGFTAKDDPKHHPMQKPLRLMEWVIAFTSGTIADPYMGAGTTLRAAKNRNRKAIGIEVEERYCEAAAARMEQSALPLEFSNEAGAQ